MPRLARWIPIAFVLLLAGPSSADKVDDYILSQMQLRHIPGLSLAVVREGKVVKARGYGCANLELKAPATARSVYDLCSISKQFVAAGILMLVEEGTLGLDDPLSKHLGGLPAAWSAVTLRHLLTHTSGIKDFFNDISTDVRRDYTDEELVDLVRNEPLHFQPGDAYRYSNTGYHLLGMVIRKVTGKHYGDFLKERIFEPLGMKDTRLNAIEEVIPNRVSGYSWRGGRWVNAYYWSPSTKDYAGGGICSTVLDMAKWDAALDGERLLKRSTLRQMWSPAALNGGGRSGYGFGWALGERNGRRVVGHSGQRSGYSTELSRFIDDRLTVIVLTNLDAGNAGTICMGVASLYAPELRERPLEDPDPEIAGLVKRSLESLARGELDLGPFTPRMREFLSPGRVAELRDLAVGLGELGSLELLGRSERDGYRTYRYRVNGRKASATVTFTTDPEGRVAGASLVPE